MQILVCSSNVIGCISVLYIGMSTALQQSCSVLIQVCGQWFIDMCLKLSSNFGNLYINEGNNFRYLAIYILLKETILDIQISFSFHH